MSSWFAAPESSSEDEAGYQSNNSSDGGDVAESSQQQGSKGGARKQARGAMMFDSSDDEGVKRVVRSTKDKQFDDIQACRKRLAKALQTEVWRDVESALSRTLEVLDRSREFIEAEGIPHDVQLLLVKLEDAVMEMDNEAYRKLAKPDARARNTIKQKYITKLEIFQADTLDEAREAFEMEQEQEFLESYSYQAGLEDEEDEDSDDEFAGGSGQKRKLVDSVWFDIGEESSGVDSDFSGDSDASVDIDTRRPNVDASGRLQKTGINWFASDSESSDEEERRQRKHEKKKNRGQRRHKRSDLGAGAVSTFSALDDMAFANDEEILQRIHYIIDLGKRKRSDKIGQIRQLQQLTRRIKSVQLEVEPLILLIQLQLETRIGNSMPASVWRECYRNISRLLCILEKNPNMKFAAKSVKEENAVSVSGTDTGAEVVTNPEITYSKVQGNLVTFVERLDEEFSRSLRFTSPLTNDYLERLQDEYYLMDILERVFEFVQLPEWQSLLSYLLIEHLYFKTTDDHKKLMQRMRVLVSDAAQAYTEEEYAILHGERPPVSINDAGEAIELTKRPGRMGVTITEDLMDVLNYLTKIVMRFGSGAHKARTILCLVFHKALHDQFFEGRDILLSSHVGDSIQNSEIPDQILYHRAIAQLGLAAFRCGLLEEAQNALQELCSSQRIKELLAQVGMQTQ